MPVKLGREQIQQLLDAAVVKFEKDTGKKITRNQNPDNYIGLANKLSEISNGLPLMYPEAFEPDTSGRYDITKAQIRDALFGKVDSLKPHFSKALDEYLDKPGGAESDQPAPEPEPLPDADIQEAPIPEKAVSRKKYTTLLAVLAILFIASLFLTFKWYQYETIKHDMRILPYKPTEAEIKSLVGIWKVYSGSPQVRKSDTDRYHMVVWDILEVKYKGGYFTFTRHGPTIDHQGFMQFDRPNLVSVYTETIDSGKIVPKHSLLELKAGKDTLNAMSVSWTWDTSKNVIIGIREEYIRLGGNGFIKPIDSGPWKNRPRKFEWIKENDKIAVFEPKNEWLDTLAKSLQLLIDENSIVLKEPDDSAFLRKPEERRPGNKVLGRKP